MIIEDAIEKNRLRQGRQALMYQRRPIVNLAGGYGAEDLETEAARKITAFYSELYRSDSGALMPPNAPIKFQFELDEVRMAMSNGKVRTVPGGDQVKSSTLKCCNRSLAGLVQPF
uniref:Uncharacterized protein n=1 Tax=Panagrolaimus sp. JU765 TaxID=591449 RepID=A0AC34RGT3_9BILA